MFRAKTLFWALALGLVVSGNTGNAKQIPLSPPATGEGEALLSESVTSENIISGELRQYAFGVDTLNELLKRNLDIWKVTSTAIDVYVTQGLDNLSNDLLSNYTVLSNPVYRRPPSMDSEEEPHELKKKKPLFNLTLLSHDFHEQYHSALNTSHFLESLAHTFPNHTTLVHVGHSYEGRKIMGIKISNPNRVKKGAKERKAFVIMGAQHAREWVATSTALYIAHALLVDPVEQSTADAKHSIRRLLEHFDFHIIPLPNPDGYHYTRKHNRLWYKNRQPVSTGHGKGVCKGMDMNRNWGYEWSPASDPSADPCGHWYPGSRPFEAHEVNALASYLTYRTGGPGKVAAFLDLRSYGQMISAPFSYSCEVYPPDAEDQIEAALGAAQAASRVHGISISTGRLCETLYSAPGNIVDWAYANDGIKYSYAAHLRDTGTYGFLIPEEWIRPTGEETAVLVAYLATFISKDPKTMR